MKIFVINLKKNKSNNNYINILPKNKIDNTKIIHKNEIINFKMDIDDDNDNLEINDNKMDIENSHEKNIINDKDNTDNILYKEYLTNYFKNDISVYPEIKGTKNGKQKLQVIYSYLLSVKHKDKERNCMNIYVMP